MKKIYTHNLATDIVDIFEEFLQRKGIEIPCEFESEEAERHDCDNDAKLYGSEYSELLEDTEGYLMELFDELGEEYVAWEYE